MSEYDGQLRPIGRVAIIVSKYNELVTAKLLAGARACAERARIPADQVDVVWVAGAFELGAAAMAAARSGRYAALVALGAVIRGETPHFEFVAGETSRMLGSVVIETGVPVGFGLLTTDDQAQALARAGGAAGNKGDEAAEAAIRAADVMRQLREAR
ncbi:MAG TPA: 6,7-dimethyl-8-ribityllumazine synthase [Gemmatimonadales bacterium]|nr:6,7-dimethyl-8-ribityllumazine synthase [Gemmatimonadales bacterium]